MEFSNTCTTTYLKLYLNSNYYFYYYKLDHKYKLTLVFLNFCYKVSLNCSLILFFLRSKYLFISDPGLMLSLIPSYTALAPYVFRLSLLKNNNFIL